MLVFTAQYLGKLCINYIMLKILSSLVQDGEMDSPLLLSTASNDVQCKQVHRARSYTQSIQMLNTLQLQLNKTDFSGN